MRSIGVVMKKRYESLDAFRGICAVSVVIFHLHLVGSFTEFSFFRGADILVEFFFSLSGFVLAHGYAYNERLNFKSYVSSRFFRIFPLHIFMLFIFLLLEMCKLFACKFVGFNFNNLPFTGDNSPIEILPNMFLLQSWSSYTNHLTFNFPSWSISVEFYMYIMLFFTIFLFGRLKELSWIAISSAAMVILVSGSGALQEPVTRGLSCFFGGAFVYSIFRKASIDRISVLWCSFLEVSLVILILISVSYQGEGRQFICTLTFLATIVVYASQKGIVSSTLCNKLLQRLGVLSYSIYMTHAAILFILITIMIVAQKYTGIEMAPIIEGKRALTTGTPILNNFVAIIILAVVIAISNITYKNIEIRFNKKKRN
ncbi:acyltransferase family protein [Symbiopectobacterium purcellii]|uniref:acyltransferase family protein n=1 Tax=Symbiopectobacterium purcellii TaxID=2871826 RepID=UPI003F86F83E